MAIPFTREQFLDGFGRFNTAVWPLHLAAIAIAAAVVVLCFRGGRRASRAASLGLSALWVAAAALQGFAFTGVMPTAIPFAAAFLVQAALFAAAAFGDRLEFGGARSRSSVLGLVLVTCAAFLYPLVGLLAGHTYPRMPIFGLAPCPNTIFTLGVLLLTVRPVPRWLLPIPLLWSIMGISAAAQLGIVEDWCLPVAGVATAAVLAARDRRMALSTSGMSPAPQGRRASRATTSSSVRASR